MESCRNSYSQKFDFNINLFSIMDEITDNNFINVHTSEGQEDPPSLLTLILELTPNGWFNLRNETSINDVVKALLVFLNAHLSLNNSNQVSFILSTPEGSRFLYPTPAKNNDSQKTAGDEKNAESETDYLGFVSKGMYRQFRTVDEAVILELNKSIEQMTTDGINLSSKLSGALSLALTYTNRMLKLDQSISTTTASAISSAANITNKDTSSTSTASSAGTSYGNGRIKSRILVVTPNDNEDLNYISLMKSIFGAQKMKVPIDIAKLGKRDSHYLQQAADATNGVYLRIEKPLGFIQVLSTAYFIDPSIRPLIILPTTSKVNYRASCYITGKPVEIGYVCSVCLCIMSIIPDSLRCPTCNSLFDEKLVSKLKRKPIVKKRKLDNGEVSSL